MSYGPNGSFGVNGLSSIYREQDSKPIGGSISKQLVVNFESFVAVDKDGHAFDSLNDFDHGDEHGHGAFVLE